MKNKYFLNLLFLLISSVVLGQTYTMSNGANGSFSTCSGTFVDSGGSGSAYGASQSSTITFCPSTPGDKIRVSFTSFNTESIGTTCYDYLDLWYGNTVGAAGTQDDRFCGNLGAFTVTSLSPDGCISLRFTSDSSVNNAGWVATISCITPCTPPVAALVNTSTVDICPSTSLTPGSLVVPFDASNSTTSSGSVVRYEWDWGDGTSNITATPNTTHTFPATPGLYLVRLRVRNNNTATDPLGCLSSNSVTRTVRVMPAPLFTGTSTGPISVTCGNSATLNGLAVSQTITQSTPTVISGPVGLPDNPGESFNSALDFSGLFAPGATLSPGCYPTISFDIEHSWAGDLEISLVAPSGETVMIFDQHNANYHFGTCSDGNDDDVPGCVATYTVVNTGGINWTAAAGVVTTTTTGCPSYTGTCETGNYYIPQTYNSTNPFTSLNGAQMNGVWTLVITDNIGVDDGVLSNWSLTFPTACYAGLQTITPDLTTATWSTSGSGPAVPVQTTTSTVVNNPGPSCPAPGPCVGNQLANNVSIGPFPSAGSFVYSFTVTDEFGCQYRRDVTVDVTCVCPTAAISYTGSPFCTSAGIQAAVLTGTGVYTGGTYSAPGGLTINPTTGAINPATSTAGTYTVTYTIPAGGGCPITIATTSVTIVAPPVLSVTSTTPICANANAVFNLTGTANATVTYNINGGGDQTVTLNGAGTATVTVPSVVANTTFNATLIATAGTPVTGNGLSATGGNTPANATGAISASGAAATGANCAFVDGTNTTLTITLQHTVPAGTSITISIARDSNPGAVTVSDGTASTTFNAAPNDVLQYITLVTGVSTNTITITRTGGIVWIDGVQYSFTPPACSASLGISNTVVVTPAPVITLTSAAATTNQTVCINTAITNITYNVTNATGATVAGLPAGVTGTYAAGVFTISGTPTVSGTFNYTVTTTGGCTPAATATGTITVNPLNTIAAGTSQTVCINTAITTITLATTGATGATFAGLPAGVTGSWAANMVTISGTPTAAGTFNYTVTTTGGCPPATTTGTITVNPLNTITAGSNQTVCINSAMTNITMTTTGATGATVTGLPAGVTGTWAANTVTISGTPTAAGTFNYTVTTTGGCPPATTTGTITVNPLNTITAGSNQTVCINTAMTNITMTTTGATGATVTGLPAGVTGTWAANTVTISGTPTAAGTFNYTVTTTGGCPPATTTGTITVNPLNTITAGSNQTVCINSAMTNITMTTTGATGATVTGLPAGVTGTWAANTVTISGTPTAAGTFNYTVTTTGGCPPATTTGTITVNPLNTITAGSNQTVCINTVMTNITMTTTGATGATVMGLPAGVTGTWAANTVTISGTPTAAGTFNYTVTTTGGCPPATTTGTITVNSAIVPVTGFSYATPVCQSAANPMPTGVAGFTAGGTYSSTAGLSINAATGEINLVLSTPGTYTVTYSYPASACGAAGSSTFNITITPLPAIALSSPAATAAQTVCQNAGITAITYNVTNATGATVAGLPAGVSGAYAGGVFTISGAPTVAGTFNYTVTTTGGCAPAATATGTITVTPFNTITAGSNQTVCINSALSAITMTTTGATGATVTGLPAGVTGTWAANTVTISGTPTAAGTFNYTVTTTGGCPPATTTGTITVTPLNTIAAGTNQTVCINSAMSAIPMTTTGATGATVTGLPAGVTGSWAANTVTISGTPTAAGTFNYTVTTTGGCPPATTTGTITVTPLNTIAAGTNQTVCINSAITTISLATTGATGATFAGLPAGVTGSWAANMVTISGTPTAAGTFNYTVTTTGGCPPATTTGTITVTPLNTIAAGTNQTVCINSAITTISFATTGATGATLAGLPAGVTGSWAANMVSISGTPTVSGTFNYTVTTTGGCPPATTTGTITVTPLNTIAAGSNQTVCINSAITNITLATTGATGATFAGLPAGVTGTWAANMVSISGTPTVSGTFNYTVTTTGGCPPATTTGTITVTPLNTIAAGTSQTVCINSAITNITLATTGATGATFAGLPAGVSGTWAAGMVTISGTPTAAGTFNYTVTTTGGCPPATTTGTITVTPLNTIAAGTSQTVCINSAITTISLATTGATGATFAGLPAGVTGSWAGNVVTISGTPTAAGTFNYTVATTGGCPPATTTGTITVTPLNTITAGSNQTLCINTALTPITMTTTGATGATVTGLPAGVTSSWAGNMVTISGTPTAAGTFNYTVTTIGGCPPATTTGTINVNPSMTPITGFSYPTPVCKNGTDPVPTGVAGFTTGGTYSSTAGLSIDPSTGVITLSTSTAGTYTVTYTYPATTCGPMGSSTFAITITPLPAIALTSAGATANQTVCINTMLANITYNVTDATGATVAGLPAGVSGTYAAGAFTISGTPTAAGTFNYTVTTTGGCAPAATATGTITVTPQNTIAAGTNQTVCINSAITTISLATTGATGATFAGLPAGVTGTWAGNVATISGTPTVSGTFNYTVTTTGGCPPATTTGTITVTPLNTIAAGTNQTVCINSAITTISLATTGATGATFAGLPAGVTGTWAGNVATISGTPTVSGTFNYTVTTTGGCPLATTTGTITVTPLNTIAAGTSQTVCINSAITTISLATTGATGATFAGLPAGVTGTWAGNVATISGTPTVSGTFNYTVTTTGGCPPATTTGTITVTPLNTIAAGTSQTVCINSAITTISLATTGATGATFAGLPAGVTGTWAGNVATISGTPTSAGTFNYTVTTTGGCPPATTTGTITVTPLNTIAAGTSQTVCINSAITTISLATTGATGATFAGLPAGVTGTWAGNVATVSGTPTSAGTFNYTVTTTGGCPPATTTGTIIVNEIPNAGADGAITICDSNTTPIDLFSLISGEQTGGVWVRTSGTGGVFNAGSATFTPAAGSTSSTFTYTITAIAPCPDDSSEATITINHQAFAGTDVVLVVCPQTASAIHVGSLLVDGDSGGTWVQTSGPMGNFNPMSQIFTPPSGAAASTSVFTYTVPSTAPCVNDEATVTITVNRQAVAGTDGSTTVCDNSGNVVDLYSLITGEDTGGTWTRTSGTGGVFNAGAGTYTPTVGATTSTFTYTIVGLDQCFDVSSIATVNITPQNTIAAGTNQTVCINSAITTISLATTGATGATVTGLPAGVTGTWAANMVTISGTPTVSGTFNYTVTTTGGCPPATTTGTITVTPLNTIAAGTSQTVCINSAITTISLATTGATGATFAGLPAGVTGTWAANVATISGTPTVSGTFNYTVTTTGGCPPATTTGTITVTPLNTIAAGTNQTVCINSAITTISLATTGATGATFAGLPAGVTGTWAGNVATISGTPTVSGTFNYTVTTTGGCPPATTTGTITVTPLNTIAAGTSQTVCINSAITTISLATTGATGATFAGLPAGVTGTWAGNVATISGTPTVSGTFNYTVTTTGGCPPATTTGTITVTPLNTIVAGTSQTVCINSAITNITLATTGATGATFAGLPAGVTGTWAGNMVTISGTPSVSGTFNYTVTTTGGCPPATTTGTITVNPIPNAIATPASQTICSGTASNIALSSAVSGTTYSWTVVQTDVTGAANGSGATIAQVLTSTGTVSGTAVYTITPSANGCIGAPINVTITVNPLPAVTATPASETICSGQSTGITLSSTIAGTTYSWTVAQSGATGATNGSGSVISQVLTTTGNTMGTVTYTVTPMFNGCAGTPLNVQVSVTPRATMTATAASTNICSGGTASITFASSLPGTVYNWNVVQTYATGASNGTGASISQVLTATGNTPGQAVYTITPVTNGCPGTPVTVIINVNPIPTVAASPSSQTVCSGTATNIVLTGTLPNTTFTWNVIQSGVYGAAAGSGNAIIQTLSTVGLTPGTVDYIITPHSNGCSGSPITVTVTVNPTPEVFGSPSNTVICSGEAAEFSLTPNIPGTTFTWIVDQNGVTGASGGSGNTNPVMVSQPLQTIGNSVGTVTYTITPSANGCSGNPISITFTVNPLPQPQIQDGYICIDQVTGAVLSTHTLDTGLSDSGYDFVWFLGTDEIDGATSSTYEATQAGVYSVIVTNTVTGCVSQPAEATVTESYAAQSLSLFVNEAFSNNPTITAVVTGGSGNFLYQIDGGAYQTSNEFTGILPGDHVVHVIDANGCTDLTQTIFVIGYPHFFTPNGDSYNEYWNIKDLNEIGQGDAEIMIFDRYGKFLKQITPAGEGWNGTYNGEALPSTDYWFTVKFRDGVNQEERIFKAHFSMKR